MLSNFDRIELTCHICVKLLVFAFFLKLYFSLIIIVNNLSTLFYLFLMLYKFFLFSEGDIHIYGLELVDR